MVCILGSVQVQTGPERASASPCLHCQLCWKCFHTIWNPCPTLRFFIVTPSNDVLFVVTSTQTKGNYWRLDPNSSAALAYWSKSTISPCGTVFVESARHCTRYRHVFWHRCNGAVFPSDSVGHGHLPFFRVLDVPITNRSLGGCMKGDGCAVSMNGTKECACYGNNGREIKCDYTLQILVGQYPGTWMGMKASLVNTFMCKDTYTCLKEK